MPAWKLRGSLQLHFDKQFLLYASFVSGISVVSEGLKVTLNLLGTAVLWDVTCVMWRPHIPGDGELNIHGLKKLKSEQN